LEKPLGTKESDNCRSGKGGGRQGGRLWSTAGPKGGTGFQQKSPVEEKGVWRGGKRFEKAYWAGKVNYAGGMGMEANVMKRGRL